MGPFPIELCKENGTVSLQPRGARDGDLSLATLIDKENSTSFEMLRGARDGDLCLATLPDKKQGCISTALWS